MLLVASDMNFTNVMDLIFKEPDISQLEYTRPDGTAIKKSQH
jgi:hypothetical protein